ncbi:hypothetical protein LINPERPRIM_LOCUS9919 [Linum perenne]
MKWKPKLKLREPPNHRKPYTCFANSSKFSSVEPWLMPGSNGGFAEYMASKGELAYQQLCSEITTEFNNCSKQIDCPFHLCRSWKLRPYFLTLITADLI